MNLVSPAVCFLSHGLSTINNLHISTKSSDMSVVWTLLAVSECHARKLRITSGGGGQGGTDCLDVQTVCVSVCAVV
jgi:hypothetical protein